MNNDADGLGSDFDLWRQLTDDLKDALEALARGESGARERTIELSLALRRLRPNLMRPHVPD